MVRSNWNRVQQENQQLQHQQSQLAQEYHQKLDTMQKENRRTMERLETAAAFRVRCSPDAAHRAGHEPHGMAVHRPAYACRDVRYEARASERRTCHAITTPWPSGVPDAVADVSALAATAKARISV